MEHRSNLRGALLVVVLCANCAQVSQTRDPLDLGATDLSVPDLNPGNADLISPSPADLSTPADLASAADLGPFVEGANYQISDKMNGQVMSLGNNMAVVQQPLANTPDQRWSLHQVSPGRFEIINNSNQSCIDVTNQSTNSAPLLIWTCIGNTSQQWSFQDAGNGFYNIVNKNSGLFIDVPGGSSNPGTGLIQYPNNNGGDNQKWLFTKLP